MHTSIQLIPFWNKCVISQILLHEPCLDSWSHMTHMVPCPNPHYALPWRKCHPAWERRGREAVDRMFSFSTPFPALAAARGSICSHKGSLERSKYKEIYELEWIDYQSNPWCSNKQPTDVHPDQSRSALSDGTEWWLCLLHWPTFPGGWQTVWGIGIRGKLRVWGKLLWLWWRGLWGALCWVRWTRWRLQPGLCRVLWGRRQPLHSSRDHWR